MGLTNNKVNNGKRTKKYTNVCTRELIIRPQMAVTIRGKSSQVGKVTQ